MSEAEKLLKRAGARRAPCKKHIVYVLQGERFTLHHGTRRSNAEVQNVRMRLRRMGLLERGT